MIARATTSPFSFFPKCPQCGPAQRSQEEEEEEEEEKKRNKQKTKNKTKKARF